jgi:hypothetical protein
MERTKHVRLAGLSGAGLFYQQGFTAPSILLDMTLTKDQIKSHKLKYKRLDQKALYARLADLAKTTDDN